MSTDAERPRTIRGSTRYWSIAIGILVLLVILTIALKMLRPFSLRIDELARAPADCNLHEQPCSAQLSDGATVDLRISPADIPLVHPLVARVRVKGGSPIDGVAVDFRGVDMDMGYNRWSLKVGENKGEYLGAGMLPMCVRDRMLWEARVLLYDGGKTRAASFLFETRQPGD